MLVGAEDTPMSGAPSAGLTYLFDLAMGWLLGTPLVPALNDLSPGDEFGIAIGNPTCMCIP